MPLSKPAAEPHQDQGTNVSVAQETLANPSAIFSETAITAPHAENFDDVETPDLPEGWTGMVEHTNSSADVLATTSFTPFSEPNHVQILEPTWAQAHLGEHHLALITPPLDAFEDRRIRFHSKTTGSDPLSMILGTFNDPADYQTFTPVDTLNVTSEYREYVVMLDEYSNGDSYFAFYHGESGEGSNRSLFIDDFHYEAIPDDPGIYIVTTELDFDFIFTGGLARLPLSVTNIGGSDLEITINLTGAPITADPDQLTISSGQSLEWELTFAPDDAGTYSGEIILNTNDPDNPEITIPYSGEAEDPVVHDFIFEDFGVSTVLPEDWEASGYSIWFSNGLDDSHRLSALLTATAPAHWFNTPFVEAGDDPVFNFAYRTVSRFNYPEDPTPPDAFELIFEVTTDYGFSYTEFHRIDESVHEETTDYTFVNLSLDEFVDPEDIIRVRVTANWLNLQPRSDFDNIILGTPPDASLAFEPESLDFGQVISGQSATDTVRIINEGYTEVPVELLLDNGAYSFDGPESFNLQPRRFLDIAVAFEPEATGTLTGTLTGSIDDQPGSDASLDLSGEGTGPPDMVLDPDELSADLQVGETEIQTLLIENPGDFDLDFKFGIDPADTVDAFVQTDFSGTFPPDGWERTPTASSSWFQTNSDLAGGEAPEARIFGTSSAQTLQHLITPVMNTSDSHQLIASFRHAASQNFGTYDIMLQTSADGGDTWSTVQTWPVGTIPPTLEQIMLGREHGVGSDQFRVAWVFQGSLFSLSYWAIDDVMIYDPVNRLDWITMNPLTGTVEPGESEEVEVTFDATNLIGGEYQRDIPVEHNIPDESDFTLPASLQVTGIPEFSADTLSLSFGEVFAGGEKTLILEVTNTGTDVLEINNITSSHTAFSADPDQFDVSVGQIKHLELTFAPEVTGAATASLELQSNDPDSPHIIEVDGEGIEPPEIVIDADQLSMDLITDESDSLIVSISNTGGNDLQFDITVNDPAVSGPDNHDTDTYEPKEDPNTFLLLSESFDQAFQNWPPEGWERTTTGSSSNWTFNSSQNQAGGEPPEAQFSCISTQIALQRLITSEINTQSLTEVLLDFRHFISHSSGTYDLMLQTSADGGDTWQTVAGWPAEDMPAAREQFRLNTDHGVGSEEFRVAWAFDGNCNNIGTWRLDDIRIHRRWLQAAPLSSVVTPGDAMEVIARFDAPGMITGSYELEMVVKSNDPAVSETILPAVLNVTGIPELAFEPDTLDFGEYFVGMSETRTLTLSNQGTGELVITNISADDTGIETDITEITLDAGESRDVQVTWTPQEPGPPASGLVIESNDPAGPHTAALEGAGIDPPVLAISHDTLSVVLDEESETLTLTIENQGGSTLEYYLVIGANADTGDTDNVTTIPLPDADGSGSELQDDELQQSGAGSGGTNRSGFDTALSIADNDEPSTDANIPGMTREPETRDRFDRPVTPANHQRPDQPQRSPSESSGDQAGSDAVTDLSNSSDREFLLQEFFNDPEPPEDWEIDHNWDITATSHAGGEPYELLLHPEGGWFSVANIRTPSINTINLQYVTVRFRHTIVVHDEDGQFNFSMRGHEGDVMLTNAALMWEKNVPPRREQRSMGADHAVGSGDFKVNWQFSGISDYIVHWAIDNIEIFYHPWMNVDRTDGEVEPGESQDIIIILDPAKVEDGVFNSDIQIVTNDPENGEQTVPVSMTTGSRPIMMTDPMMLEFDPVRPGESETKIMTFSNAGGEVLQVTDIISDHDYFTVDDNTSFTIDVGGDPVEVPVTFAPQSTGPQDATFTIHNNEPETPIERWASGYGGIPPSIVLDPEAIDEVAVEGESITVPVTVYNDGEEELTFQLLSFEYVTVNPDHGTVPGGESTEISVTINTANLELGQHEITLQGISNDPDRPTLSYPVSVIVREESAYSSAANHGFSGYSVDPVNTFTGELYLGSLEDLYLDGPKPLYFARYYGAFLNSDNRVSSALGPNWTHNFDWKLDFGDPIIELITDRGRVIPFLFDGEEFFQLDNLDTPYQLIITDDELFLVDPQTGVIREFNTSGNMIRVDDGMGDRHILSYNNNRLQSVSDEHGRTLTFSYNDERLVQVSDGNRTVQFGYNSDGVLVSATNPLGDATTYTYDQDHEMTALLTKVTLPEGNTRYTQEYDDQGRVTAQSDAHGNTWTLEYEEDYITRITDPAGNQMTHKHSDAGELIEVIDQSGRSITMDYDGRGFRTGITDRRGHSTGIEVDESFGLPVSLQSATGTVSFTYSERTSDGYSVFDLAGISYQDGSSITYSRDANGNPVTISKSGGRTWEYTYDNRGRVLTETNPEGGETAFTYHSNGLMASITDHAGNTTDYEYDEQHRLVAINLPDGNSYTTGFNDADRMTSSTNENGDTWTWSYDKNGNLVTITEPDGASTQYAYDEMDRLVTVTDPEGNVSHFTYNNIGLIASYTNPDDKTTRYEYDQRGRLSAFVDEAGGRWNRSYNDEGVVESLSTPAGYSRHFDSDDAGRVTTLTDGSSGSYQLSYDERGRITSVRDPLGNSTGYQYDQVGALSSVTMPGGLSAGYERDGMGHLTRITDPAGNHWGFSYDALGRMTSMSDPRGNTTEYTYDNRHRVTQTDFPGGMGSANSSYDGAGNLTTASWSDGTSFEFSWDEHGRMLSATGISLERDQAGRITASNSIDIQPGSGGLISTLTLPGGDIQYSYNERGEVTGITDWLGGTVTLEYDSDGRLIEVVRPNGIRTEYTYDGRDRITSITEDQSGESAGVSAAINIDRNEAGNIVRMSRTVPQGPQPFSDSRQWSFNSSSETEAFSHDPMGRVTEDDHRSYSWNLASHLTGYTDGNNEISFTYDAFGNILTRRSAGSVREYIWNYATGLPSLAVEKENGNDLLYHIYLPGGILLYSIEAQTDERRFYHFDETGNTIFVTDDEAGVIATYAYTPYGEILAESGTIDNVFTFRGRYGVMREDDDLYLVRARFYDAQTGRFLARDPVLHTEPREINPYQYAMGNPLRYADPTGHESIALEDLDLQQIRDHLEEANRRTRDWDDPEGAVRQSMLWFLFGNLEIENPAEALEKFYAYEEDRLERERRKRIAAERAAAEEERRRREQEEAEEAERASRPRPDRPLPRHDPPQVCHRGTVGDPVSGGPSLQGGQTRSGSPSRLRAFFRGGARGAGTGGPGMAFLGEEGREAFRGGVNIVKGVNDRYRMIEEVDRIQRGGR